MNLLLVLILLIVIDGVFVFYLLHEADRKHKQVVRLLGQVLEAVDSIEAGVTAMTVEQSRVYKEIEDKP